MLRFLVRLMGYAAVAAGFVALVVDGARSIANGIVQVTALGETLSGLFGARYQALQPAVERNIHPLLWDPVLLHLMLAPTALVALVLGFLLLRLGRPPRREIGFLTRS